VPEKLKNLKVVMNSFNVGHGREFSVQQLGELNFEGSLSIGDLKNILNYVDAFEANLPTQVHQLNQECCEIGIKIVTKCNRIPFTLKTMKNLLYNKS